MSFTIKHAITFEEKGRSHPDSQAAIFEIGELFKTFKLVPKQFDRMVKQHA